MKQLLLRMLALLTKQEKKGAAKVALAVFFSAVLDFLSIAVLLPVLYYLLDGTAQKKAALLFCLLTVLISAIKFFVGKQLTIFQNRYVLGLYKRMSFSLYSSYFRRGLLFIRQNSVNRLARDVNGICYSFSQSVLAPLMKMAGDGLLIVLMAIGLIVYSPLTALVLVLCFVPLVLVYLFVIQGKAKDYGDKELEAKREQVRLVYDTFGGYADLQVSDAFDNYRRQFQQQIDKISENRLRLATMLRLPAFLTELAVVLGLTAIAAFGVGDVKILIGVFAVASFRLLPAVKSLMSGWTLIKNAEYCVDVIEQGLGEEQSNAYQGLSFKKSFAFNNLSYSYPDGGQVFDKFNLEIEKGSYVGLKGDSGAGKSTLFNILLGFLKPDSGEVLIDGQALTEENQHAWLSKLGYVTQDVFIFSASLAENISMGDPKADPAKIREILSAMNLDEWFAELPDGLQTQLGERGGRLSGGQKQRIGIARALYKDVEVLLLDEATSSLDNENEKEVLEIIDKLREKKPELTVLSIAHRESSLKNCERVIKL